MRVLVTGANGFVGGWLIRRLLADGHTVVGAVGLGPTGDVLDATEQGRVAWMPLTLEDPASVDAVAATAPEAVVHLAGVSSVSASLTDPVLAWRVNALGTAMLFDALTRGSPVPPRVLLVSSAEVYGRGPTRPRVETDVIAPLTPYAASKAAAEIAAGEIWRRAGLPVVIARPFPHTGPGQSDRFVVPAFVARIRVARRTGAPVVKTGNLEPVRDLLDVRDVVEAYLALLARGTAGEAYNIASGTGSSLEDLFHRIARLAGHRVLPEPDHALARAIDIPHLVGDAAKLHAATGWTPRHALDHTLQQMLDAETD